MNCKTALLNPKQQNIANLINGYMSETEISKSKGFEKAEKIDSLWIQSNKGAIQMGSIGLNSSAKRQRTKLVKSLFCT